MTHFKSIATPLFSQMISGLGLPTAAQSNVTDAPADEHQALITRLSRIG